MNKLTLPETHCACTVSQLLKQSGYSLTHRRKLKKHGRFFIDGQPAHYISTVSPEQTLEIKYEQASSVIPEQGALAIAYEDDYLLVLDKPPGMLVHPVGSEVTGTLANYLAAYSKDQTSFDGLHFVSRLDRDTSGLLLVAKTSHIKHLLERCQLQKSYLALLTNTPPATHGLIDLPIARKPGSIIERCIDIHGKKAQSAYKLLRKYANNACLVHLQALTGRTHQLRVHMAALGCPLWGDSLYGQQAAKTRHCLHAAHLAFIHPITKEKIAIASKLPGDIIKIILTFQNLSMV